MKLITDEMYDSRFPKKEKSVVEEMDRYSKNLFYTLYALYSDFLYEYLLKHTDIKKYDDMLSEMNSNVISNDRKDLYQFLSSNYLKNLYVRNNLYIERLSDADIRFLTDRILNAEYDYDEKVEELIERTFRTVIFDEIGVNNVETNYGPDAPDFYAPVDSLVIGDRIDNDKVVDATQLMNDLNLSIQESLNVKTTLIHYSDESVHKIGK